MMNVIERATALADRLEREAREGGWATGGSGAVTATVLTQGVPARWRVQVDAHPGTMRGDEWEAFVDDVKVVAEAVERLLLAGIVDGAEVGT